MDRYLIIALCLVIASLRLKVGLNFRRRQALCRALSRSRASQMRVKALAAYLFIIPTPASARVNARQNAWRGAIMLQSSTVLNFRVSRQQFSQSCTGVKNWVCSGLSLQLRQWARYWAISPSRRGRNALVITVKEQLRPRGSNCVFHSCLPSPYIELTLFL